MTDELGISVRTRAKESAVPVLLIVLVLRSQATFAEYFMVIAMGALDIVTISNEDLGNKFLPDHMLEVSVLGRERVVHNTIGG